jgi:uncharacterized protein (TIGR01319 family)
MKIDVLVAEIGSTTTILNAFNIHGDPVFLGRGVANTTVATDVNEGLLQAMEDLKAHLHVDELTYDEMFATSSAAGGLRVTVHGLVYEMTVRASKEAALNAGANIHLVTAGKIKKRDLERIREIRPNMILVAGGTDYGEYETALHNIEQVLKMDLDIPILYAGNIENHADIREMFEKRDKSRYLRIVENVYPRVDFLNIRPLRKAIYETFEENIIHAPGMGRIHDLVTGHIMPTPGSVMEATMILRDHLGDLMTIDVGGATTDIHSVAEPSDEFKEYQEGEPLAKRTVEGDLGVFINHKNVISLFPDNTLAIATGIPQPELDELIAQYSYIPTTKPERKLVYELTKKCTHLALDRHVGDLRRVFTSSGQKIIPEGKDLTQVKYILLTGGSLIHLNHTEEIVHEYLSKNPRKLLPNKHVRILRDQDYIMASIGVLSLKYPGVSVRLLRKSLRLE